MPMTIRIGNAIYISPNKTIPINNIGISTTVISVLAIPHAALIPKKNSFPKTHSKYIKNMNVNIEFLLPIRENQFLQSENNLFHILTLLLSFSCLKYDLFFAPIFLLNSGFFSIFAMIRINCILFLVSISIILSHIFFQFLFLPYLHEFSIMKKGLQIHAESIEIPTRISQISRYKGELL